MRRTRPPGNTLVKTLVTGAVVFASVLGVYTLYRKRRAAETGGDYALSRAPADLAREIGQALSPGEAHPSSGAAESASGRPPAPAPDGAAFYRKGRTRYLAGAYLEAIPFLAAAARSPTAPSHARVLTLLGKARLFQILLEDVRPAAGPGDRPLARVVLPGGSAFFGELVSETEDALTLAAEKGVGGRFPRAKLAAAVIARTPAEKRTLLEEEYRRRHEGLGSPADCLELARFAHRHGLDAHVTYLMERALDRGPDLLETLLHRKYEEAKAARRSDRVELILDLFRTFFRTGVLARSALAESRAVPSRPPPRPGFGPSSSPPVPDREPPSGIGGVGHTRSAGSNPELRKLIAKADTLREEGDRHYPKARPGLPDAAVHRKKALAAYRAAVALYEQIEDRFGWSFEGTFQILYQRIYNLMNDTRLR